MNSKDHSAIEALKVIQENSQFLKRLEQLRAPEKGLRPLSTGEIMALETRGNHCTDWSTIRVTGDFSTEHIHRNYFSGRCILGLFTGRPVKVDSNTEFPSGIYSSTIINSTIENDALVAHTDCVSGYIICGGAVVYGAGALTSPQSCTFGNGTVINVGNEIGRRTIALMADMDFETASAIIMDRKNEKLQSASRSAAKSYLKALKDSPGIVERAAVLRHCGPVKNSYIGEGTVIDGVTLVEDCTILSSEKEPVQILSGSVVRKSCLQWGCRVSDMALVDSTLLTDHSGAERHGKVTASIIGANSDIAEGEITSSLVGPFTGYHHQSLLIAALWPEGKGNVGYGANVGSNHTGKAPDQELRCGEGVFFGLGTSIKFPACYSEAPYSIIATGVNTAPQRVEFPFSLINSPSLNLPEIPLSHNEISPGWILANNIYAIIRNRNKFLKRNHSKRAVIEAEVFRPEIIDLMLKARDRLAASPANMDIYTEKTVPGLGANYMTKRSRNSGIENYTLYIHYYIQRALWNRLRSMANRGALRRDHVLHDAGIDPAWEHARKLFLSEKLGDIELKVHLRSYAEKCETIAQSARKSKERDDRKGRPVIDDYDEAGVPAEDDQYISDTLHGAAETKKAVEEFIRLNPDMDGLAFNHISLSIC